MHSSSLILRNSHSRIRAPPHTTLTPAQQPCVNRFEGRHREPPRALESYSRRAYERRAARRLRVRRRRCDAAGSVARFKRQTRGADLKYTRVLSNVPRQITLLITN